MRKIKLWVNLFMIALMPFSFVHAEEIFPPIFIFSNPEFIKWKAPKNYDQILELLDEIESDDFEKKYSQEDLQNITEYLIFLAREGLLPGEFKEALELEEDIEELLQGRDLYESTGFSKNPQGYLFESRVFYLNSSFSITNCGFGKCWKKTKKFVKKHKTAIIVGTVVVLAVTATVVALAVASSTQAAAVASGAVAAVAEGSKKPEGKKFIKDSELKESTELEKVVEEPVYAFKEFLVEDKTLQKESSLGKNQDSSFSEKARELGSCLAHEVYQEVTELVSVMPQLCEEVKSIGSKILPESICNDEMFSSPTENYEKVISKGHEVIDKVFGTDQSYKFGKEARAYGKKDVFDVGIIPIPGMIGKNGSINVKKFSNLGKKLDRGGFTKAGRSSMKHGYREGSVFPKPLGSPPQINNHGQEVLNEILNHPQKIIKQYTHRTHGAVIEIEAPGIGGVRFRGDGSEMIGFLEPYWLKN